MQLGTNRKFREVHVMFCKGTLRWKSRQRHLNKARGRNVF